MDEQRIRQIVQEEIKRNSGSAQFGFNSVPFHIHNGVDSNPVYTPTLTYAGYVPFDPTDPSAISLLPQGWSAEYFGSGYYEVTHNLNSSLYSVVITPTQSTNQWAIPIVGPPFNNVFNVTFFDSSLQTPVATSFMFLLTRIDNTSSPLVQYVSRGLN